MTSVTGLGTFQHGWPYQKLHLPYCSIETIAPTPRGFEASILSANYATKPTFDGVAEFTFSAIP
jgi:hypothetical protein